MITIIAIGCDNSGTYVYIYVYILYIYIIHYMESI